MKKLYSLMLVMILAISSCVQIYASDTTYEASVALAQVQNETETRSLQQFASVDIEQVGVQVIPTTPLEEGVDLVNKGEVIYRFKYKLTGRLINGGIPIGMFGVYYTPTDPVVGLEAGIWDSTGNAYVEVDIRGTNSVLLRCLTDNMPVSVTVNPTTACYYESPFWVTCYNTPDESEFTGSKISVSGITDAQFKSDFIEKTKVNGSGLAESGRYIRFSRETGLYSYQEPTTATGTVPVVGQTIAVDHKYIPRYGVAYQTYKMGRVYIDGIGNRIAEDAGGTLIEDYDIDVYVGVGNSGVSNFVTKYRTVKFLGTVTY